MITQHNVHDISAVNIYEYIRTPQHHSELLPGTCSSARAYKSWQPGTVGGWSLQSSRHSTW